MKNTFLTIAILWIALNGKAQIHSFGVQGGLNLTNISAKELFDDTDYKIGFVGGLKYELVLSEKYLLGADLLYSQQGFVDRLIFIDQNGNPTGEDSDAKFKYDYLSLPLMFGYTIGNNLKITPKIGIQPSLLLNAKAIVPNFDNNGDLIGEVTIVLKEYVSQFDLAALLEIELGYSVTHKIDIFASISGKYSMTTFSNTNYFEQSKLRHKLLSLSIGLKYKMAKD